MSDIHIGMSPDTTMFWSDDRALDIKETFANVIKKCKEEKIDFLLISGDLFNHQPLTEELNFVNDLFKTISDIKVIIIAGSSDHIKSNSLVLNYKFADNVYYFLDKTEYSFKVSNKLVVIHGFSYYSLEDTTPIINSITPENDNYIHILLAYGGDKNHTPFDINKLDDKNYSYIALGSKHNYEVLIDGKAYYSGSIEPLDSNDIGDHGIIIGEINPNTKRAHNIRFEKMSKVSYIPVNIKINGSNSEEDISEIVMNETIRYGLNNIFKIKITGYRNPDIEITRDIFDEKIRIVELTDNTIPKYDFIKLSSEHPQDMIGAFIRKMISRNDNLSDIEKRALYLGTHALIKTSENKD
ncbi:MAG: metallophosphoesterase [Lachnospiraceae bacterium]|nr:metallophosphoesterase [Lachnospiraceae bacterium]